MSGESKMFWRLVLLYFLLGSPLLAFGKGLKAHVHGESIWSLAFEGAGGKLVIDAPSEAILGFEYEPKKKKDVEKSAALLQKFENKISEMIVLPKELSCQWSKKSLDILRAEGETKHSEIDGEFEIVCQKDVAGAEVIFNIQKYFPRFRLVNVEVLIDNIQKSVPVTKSGTRIFLK